MAADGQATNSRGTAIVAVSAVFSALAILMVFLRFVARKSRNLGYQLDDWLILAALVVTLGVTINNIVGVTYAGVGEVETYRTDGPAIGFPTARVLKPQGQVMFALQILHTCAMPLIKAAVLAFYLRIFPTRKFRIAVWIVGVYIAMWWISILFATIFQCMPISDNWGTDPTQLTGCIQNINIMYEVAAVTNMASDVFILALPFPAVMALQMHTGHKVLVLGIFLTGAVVVVAGIGRTVSYFQLQYNQDTDFSYHYYSLVIWTSVEPTLGVIGACLPTLRPVFKGMSPESVIGSIRSALSLRSFRSGQSGHEGKPDNDREDREALHHDDIGDKKGSIGDISNVSGDVEAGIHLVDQPSQRIQGTPWGVQNTISKGATDAQYYPGIETERDRLEQGGGIMIDKSFNQKFEDKV